MRRLALAAAATLISALVSTLVSTPSLAAPPADIDGYVAKTLATFDAPGFSLAIVEGEQTVLAKGYGVRTLGEKAPADAHTIFPIGSCTKAFVATGLAILVDEGKLSWDDKVA